jgi:hypothetical protein
MPVYALREVGFCHRRGLDAKPIRMEMDHDAGVSSDTFHRFGVVVGCTISTLKEVVHASPRGDLSSVHHVLYMT